MDWPGGKVRGDSCTLLAPELRIVPFGIHSSRSIHSVDICVGESCMFVIALHQHLYPPRVLHRAHLLALVSHPLLLLFNSQT